MKQLVITTKSWHSLIESLKGNSKHGYSSLESLKHDGVYFTAVLCQDTDSAYTERLKIVTGTETDIEEWIAFLTFGSVQTEVVVTEAVVTKIKRMPRKPKEDKL